MNLFKDADGKVCLAKTNFAITSFSFLVVIAYLNYAGKAVDYTGMSAYLIAVGGIYFGRSHTKAGKNV